MSSWFRGFKSGINISEKHHWSATADKKMSKDGRLVPKGHIILSGTDTKGKKEVEDPRRANKSASQAMKHNRLRSKRMGYSNDEENGKGEKSEMISFLEVHNARLNSVEVHSSVEEHVNEFNEAGEGKMFWQPLTENTALIRIRNGEKLLESLGLSLEEVGEVAGNYQVADCVFNVQEIEYKDTTIFEVFVFEGNLAEMQEATKVKPRADKFDSMTPDQLKALAVKKGVYSHHGYSPDKHLTKNSALHTDDDFSKDPTGDLSGKNKIYRGALPGNNANRFAKKASISKQQPKN